MGKLLITILVFVVVGFCGLNLGFSVSRNPEVGLGVFVGALFVLICFVIVSKDKEDPRFVVRLFLLAVGLRLLVGGSLYYFGFLSRIGPDYNTYDHFSYALLQTWQGKLDPNVPWLNRYISVKGSGWGMYYYVASVYYLIGRNPLAIQLISCSFGAICCVLVYKITRLVHPLPRVARFAAILAAVAPSTVLWTAQGIKEAPIMLCLCASTYLTLRLSRKISLLDFMLLAISLFCLYSLRNYVFYIMFMAIVAALIFAAKKITPVRAMQGAALVIILGLAFAYFGAGETAQKQFDLKRIQSGRKWSAKEAESSYGNDVDITEPEAVLTYLPLGVIYVLFAPFPWMIKNLGQLITLPEMVVWWLSAPLLIRGFWFSIRQRFRDSFAIALFTIGLTLSYALFQSNFGTAHRQRAQIFIFFFIFVSIGWELRRESKIKHLRRMRITEPALRQPAPTMSAGQFG